MTAIKLLELFRANKLTALHLSQANSDERKAFASLVFANNNPVGKIEPRLKVSLRELAHA